MQHFPEEVAFKLSWRSYQQKVLNEFEHHAQDKHLHIIAPPGSGKTILGLEVARRLNQPTLILVPTLSIRNQWIQRFTDCFLPLGKAANWISHSIKDPRFLTVATYQSLHAACSGMEDPIPADEAVELEAEAASKSPTQPLPQKNITYRAGADRLINELKKTGIRTIVVDEAHHLQNEWWKSLDWVRKQLGEHFVVALTATPPYDVSGNEWKRYSDLCGSVDAEIGVPELVVAGDLCPHQDYVHFSLPNDKETEKLHLFRQRIHLFYQETTQHEAFIQAVENHPFFVQPQLHLEAIYENPAYYSSILIFLRAVGRPIPPTHTEVIGNKHLAIPTLNLEWLEILLNHFMYKDAGNFAIHEKLILELERKLKNYGALEQKRISFQDNEKTRSLLGSSIGKLQSMVEIVQLEYNGLRENLRMVILTDFIRQEMMPKDHFDTLEINKMGVFPIFETLRRKLPADVSLGVLTGTLVIIPKQSLSLFRQIVREFHAHDIETIPLKHESDYLSVKADQRMQPHLVHLVTVLFERGGIHVLVGTKSLLGEGWDAPCINSLVLASFVGSYVSSNQMRGRAIRSQPGNRGKTGNIWHLVCIDPTSSTGGQDLALLARRFKAFTGVSFREQATIENGISRLNFSSLDFSSPAINQINQAMARYALNRPRLKEEWAAALQSGSTLVEAIKVPYQRKEREDYQQQKIFYFRNTTRYALYEATLGVGYFAVEYAFNILKRINSLSFSDNLQTVFKSFLIAFGIYYGPKLYRAARLYLKHGAIEKEVAQIGQVLLGTLLQQGTLQTDPARLSVVAQQDGRGTVYCHLQGGSAYEQSLFNRAMEEILGNIDNPRYLIVRKNTLFDVIRQQDYHPVPQLIGNRKASAEAFANLWKNCVGKCSLVYTRTPEGRQTLLTARINSLASAFLEKTEKVSRWK